MNKENGNALFLILIAVALFAALSYAVTQSGRGGTGVDKERAQILAAQIIQYAGLVAQSIQRLKIINRCSDLEISLQFDSNGNGVFDTDGSDAFFNSLSPSDFSCHAHHPNGGGVNYQEVSLDALQSSPPALGWHYNIGLPIEGLGTPANDANLQLNFLNQDVCVAINNLIGIDNPSGIPPEENNGTPAPTLTDPPPADILGDDGTGLSGQPTFCRFQSSVPLFQFVHVLITR